MGIVNSILFNVSVNHQVPNNHQQQNDENEGDDDDIDAVVLAEYNYSARPSILQGPLERKEWDEVLEIVRSDIGPREARRPAIDNEDESFGFIDPPLLLACRLNAPYEVIEAIFHAFPRGMNIHDDLTALHEAAFYHEDINVMKLLINADPIDGPKQFSRYEYEPLPIHHLMRNDHVSVDMVQLFLDAYPDSINVRNRDDYTLLHIACQMSENVSDEVQENIIIKLLIAYPEAIQHRTRENGLLPLHVSVSKPFPSVRVIKCLIKACPEALRTKDSSGRYPIHLLSEAAFHYEVRDKPKPSDDLVVDVMKVLLHNYPESILCTAMIGRSGRRDPLDKRMFPSSNGDTSLYFPREIARFYYGTSYTKLLSLMKHYEQKYFVSLAFDVIMKDKRKFGKKRKFSHMVGFKE